ncbi:hypothetical protein BH20ACT2_BH20ACT2_07710 [soil metagenome]
MAGKWNRKRKVLVGLTLGVAVLAPSVALAQLTFDDVPAGFPHEAGIGYVATKGITQGCDADSYCPNDSLTRGQMATFLYRASGNDPATPPSVNADTIDGLDSTQLMAGGGGADGVGLTAVETVTAAVAVTAVAREAVVTCPAGKVVIGGGAGSSRTDWYLYESRPVSSSGWVAYAIPNSAAAPQTATLTVYAICATPST